MKKINSIILLIAVLTGIILLLTGCGEKDNGEKVTEQIKEEKVTEQVKEDEQVNEKVEGKIKDINDASYSEYALTTDNKIYEIKGATDLEYATKLSKNAKSFIGKTDITVLNEDNSVTIVKKEKDKYTNIELEGKLPENAECIDAGIGFIGGIGVLYLREGSIYYSKYDMDGTQVVADSKIASFTARTGAISSEYLQNTNIKKCTRSGFVLFNDGSVINIDLNNIETNKDTNEITIYTVVGKVLEENVQDIYTSQTKMYYIYNDDKNNLIEASTEYYAQGKSTGLKKYPLPEGQTTDTIKDVYYQADDVTMIFNNGDVYKLETSGLELNKKLTQLVQEDKILKIADYMKYVLLKDNTIKSVY